MPWFWKHGNELLILFLIPIVGLAFDYFIKKKAAFYTLLVSFLLLIPIFSDYSYTTPYAFQILGLIFGGSLFYFLSTKIKRKAPKVVFAFVLSSLLFSGLGFFAFMDSMSGYQIVEKKWQINRYKIEYIIDQGFSGRPLMKYEISRYFLVPILVEKIDQTVEDDSIKSCIINFPDAKLDFDKCNASIKDVR